MQLGKVRVAQQRKGCRSVPTSAQGFNAGGHCYPHVQAITVAIDQYAEKALGNRDLLSQQAIRRRLAGASVGAISLESAFGRLHPQLHKLALIPHGIQSSD
jgi:hypothetical protein